MEINSSCSAFITGAGSGIGRALTLEFVKLGASVTVVDLSEKDGNETVNLCENLSQSLIPVTHFVKCDVSQPAQLAAAFKKHMVKFGKLDVCVNNAGIGENEYFIHDTSVNGSGKWRNLINVNLSAVIDGTRLAIQHIRQNKSGRGAIINVASAAGLYPSPAAPVYSASKGGVVLFTRSLANLAKQGIRVNALCPEFIDTPLVTQMSATAKSNYSRVLDSLGGYIPMETIVQGCRQLIEDGSKAGACLWVTNRLGLKYWPAEGEESVFSVKGKKAASSSSTGQQKLPPSFQKVIVHMLSSDFRSATRIVPASLKLPLDPNSVVVKILYAGINASDVNFSAGRYFGSEKEAAEKLPFDAGFEAVGVVYAAGESVPQQQLAVGSPVALMTYGTFAEYCLIDWKRAIPVPSPVPEVVALLTSGLTASIALEESGRMRSGETVLVTAAAGGTGQFAIQLAKLAGNKVIAVCGGEEKVTLVKQLGADVAIDYKAEDLKKALRRASSSGVDLVYESVGGTMFEVCVGALARHGRCVIIGMMSQYTAGEGSSWESSRFTGMAEKLLWKSQTLTGFFLLHYTAHWKRHLSKLYSLYEAGHLKVTLDKRRFSGLGSIPDAVAHLQSGKSVGKVVVQIDGGMHPFPGSRL